MLDTEDEEGFFPSFYFSVKCLLNYNIHTEKNINHKSAAS